MSGRTPKIAIPAWKLAEDMPADRRPAAPDPAIHCDSFCRVTVNRINSWLAEGEGTSATFYLPELYHAEFSQRGYVADLQAAGFTVTYRAAASDTSKEGDVTVAKP